MTQAPPTIGPVEYLIMTFKGNQFTGEITPALMDLLDSGMIRMIDLAVVSKDAEGNVTILEAGELSEDVADALVKLNGELTGLLSEADLMLLAEDMDNNTTDVAMLVEHVWATQFAQAVRNAKGELVTSVRIPHDVVEAARQSLLEASKAAH
jgi:hypothetical protein